MPASPRRRLTRRKTREQFLAALRAGASVAAACRSIGLSRQQCYEYREQDADFAAEWDAAVEHGTDLLEDVALRRATAGTQRNVYFGGRVVGQDVEHHDTLLIFLLKARRPEKYRERFDLSNSDGTLRGFAEAMRQLESNSSSDDAPTERSAVH